MRRETNCTFTGHRPEKLPWGMQEQDSRCDAAKRAVAESVEEMYRRGYRHFICGMARGGDFYFGEAVVALRERHADVTLEAALPCPGQTERWSREDRQRHARLREQCNFETMVSRENNPGSMLRRNRYMVRRSAAIIALFSGATGGTHNTVMHAAREGLEQIIIDPEEC